MLSKNNQDLQKRKMAAQRQHFGLRKLNVGVASVLLGASLLWWAGAKPAQAATTTLPDEAKVSAPTENPAPSSKVVPLKSVSTDSVTSQAGSPAGAAPVTTPTGATSDATPGNNPSVASGDGQLTGADQADVSSQVENSATPITGNYTEGANGQETVTIPGASLSIDGNQLNLTNGNNAGQITVTLNLSSAKAGDTFVINVPADYGYRFDEMAGTNNLQVTHNGGQYTVKVLADMTGPANVWAHITDIGNSYLKAPTPIEKLGTVVQAITLTKNGAPVDKNLTFTYVTDPAATIKAQPIKGPTINNGAVFPNTDSIFTFTVNEGAGMVANDPRPTNWIYSGTNYGTTVTIPVPKGFVLNQEVTNLYNPSDLYGTVSQAGEGAPIVVTIPKGSGIQYVTNGVPHLPGLRIVGHFDVANQAENQTLTATAAPTIEQKILITKADGSSAMQTVTKTTDPWQATILGNEATLTKVSLEVDGAQKNNQLVLNPQSPTDPNPDVVNTIGMVNNSGLSFDNQNTPADQQANFTITIPDGLTVTRITTPQNDTQLAGTTSYDYDLTLVGGQHLTGTVQAGDDIVSSGAAIRTAVITPNYLAAFAVMKNDPNTHVDDTFKLHGELAEKHDDGAAVKNGDVLTTTVVFQFSHAGTATTETGRDPQIVSVAQMGFAPVGIYSYDHNNRHQDTMNESAGDKVSTGINNNTQVGNYGTVHEPVFYYVLPTDAHANINVNDVQSNFDNNSLYVKGGTSLPKISTYLANGHQVVVLDYTGTGIDVPTSGVAINRLFYVINPDALPMTYSGKDGGGIYVLSHQELVTNTTDSSAEQAATPEQIASYLQGNPAGLNAYYIGPVDSTVLAGSELAINELSQGNNDPVPVDQASSNDKGAVRMEIDFNLINTSGDTTGQTMVAVENVPTAGDQYGNGFNFVLTGEPQYAPQPGSISADDIQFLYSTKACPEPTQTKGAMPDLSGYVTADKVTDWSTIKSVAEVIANGLPNNTAAGRVRLIGEDLNQLTDAGKTVYAQAIFFGENDMPAVNSHTTHPDITSITIEGTSTVNVALQYVLNGETHTITVPALAKHYQDNQDTMQTTDFELDHDAIVQALVNDGVPQEIAENFIQNPDNTTLTVQNGTNDSWKADWPKAANGTAAFGQKVQYDFDGDTVTVQLIHKTEAEAPETKTVTRTINVTDPQTGKVTTTTQTASFTRTPTQDLVTGEITPGDWNTDQKWDAFTAPTIAGYTASQTDVGEQVVAAKDTDQTINITYTANDQSTQIQYVTAAGQPATQLDGTVVPDVEVDGKTDEKVAVTDAISSGIPTNWELVPGQDLPADVNFAADGAAPIKVEIQHKTQDVSDTDPQATKTVTRTINVTNPVTKVTTPTVQTAKFHRTATKDLVTGTVTYGQWNNDQKWDLFTAPTIPGYTPNQVTVAEKEVTGDDSDVMVDITYTADNETVKVVFEDAQGNVIQTTPVTGKMDGTVDLTKTTIPTGWVLTGNDPRTVDYKLGVKNPDMIVEIQHGTQDVSKTDDNATKTVTRTINVTNPVTKVTTPTVQTATFHRTATKDLVTETVTYGEWNNDQKWDSFDVPTVAGYTPTEATVAEKNVTADDTDQIVNITYTANDETVKVLFEDGQGNVIQTTPVTGKMDGTVDLTKTTIPANWVLTGDDPRTTDYKLGVNNPDVIVKIQHGTQDVSDTDPNATKTVTRTINVTNPVTKVTTPTIQTATFHRTATKDLVTGTVSYGNWNDDQKWDAFNVPTIAGYTPTEITVPEKAVQATDGNVTVNVTYTADNETVKVVFEDGQGNVIQTTPVTGKMDSTVDLTKTTIPANWVLTDNDPRTTDYKLGVKNPDVIVKIQHGTQDVSTTDANATKTVTRTINVKGPYGTTKTTTQTANFSRTATKDLVTGKVTYGKWNTDQKWDDFKPEVIDGYTVSQLDVPEVKVTADNKDQTIDITYTANDQTAKITFIDDTTGATITSETANGKFGQPISFPTDPYSKMATLETGRGYEFVSNSFGGQNYQADNAKNVFKIHLKEKMVTVTPDKPKTTNDQIPDTSVYYPAGVGESDLNKMVTRTVTIVNPDGTKTSTPQTFTFTRSATVNAVTGNVTYGAWNEASHDFESVTVPIIPGYTPEYTTGTDETGLNAGTKITTGQVDSLTINAADYENTKTDTTITVNVDYTADPQSTTIKYVTSGGQPATQPDGSAIPDVSVDGKTDEKVSVTDQINGGIPTGWELVPDQNLPKDVTFGAKGADPISVKIQHKTAQVTNDQPVPEGTKTPTGVLVNGAHESDLNQTITRTINVKTPDGKTTTKTQTATITRDASYDDVTGEVTYKPWTTDSTNWTEFKPAEIPGYTVSQADVPAVTVKNGDTDQKVNITYTANKETVKVVFEDAQGNVIQTTPVTGKMDGTVDLTKTTIPANWVLTGDDPRTTDYKLGVNNPDVIVKIQHGTQDVSTTDANATKTVTRTINVKSPDGTTKTTTQTANFSRTATKDLVTGTVTYGKWNTDQKWDAFDAPTVAGYTPTEATVAEKDVTADDTDQTVNITYTADNETVKVLFEDAQGNVIQTTPVTGKMDGTVDLTKTTIPDNWVLAGNDPRTNNFKLGVTNPDVIVEIQHGTQDVSKTDDNATKTVTRTINVTNPVTKVTTPTIQTATFHRTATKDLVTEAVTYGEWNNDQKWDAFDVPAVTGYTPTETTVPEQTVQATDDNATVNVTYKADEETVKVLFEDAQGNVIQTTPVTGKMDSTVDLTKTTIPANWVLAGDDPRTSDFKLGVTNPDVIVKIQHGTQDVSDTDSNATKTVTRIINVTTPDGQTKTTTQTANFSRTATKDLVTGTVTYGKWNTDQKWDAFEVPTAAGYTPTETTVPEQNVQATDANVTVNVTYTADNETVKVLFEDGQGNVIQTTPVTGKMDSTVDLTKTTIPTNWVLAGDDPRTTDYKLETNNPDVIVKIQHGTQDVSDTDPNATKTVTRTINVTNPETKVVTPTIQTATFHRTATKDLVTGTVTYGQWNTDQKWDAFNVPMVAGYTPTEKTVPEQTVQATDDNVTVNVTYTADNETVKVLFEDGQGNVIQATQVTGKMDGTVDLTKTTIPANWVLTDDDPRTTDYKLGVKNPDVIVKIQHGTQDVSDTDPNAHKTVTRTINVTDPRTGQVTTTTQDAKFHRTATKDLVTGDVTYGNWNTDQKWDEFKPAAIDGYTASKLDVPEVKVTADNTDQTINITYTANDETVNVVFEDGAGNKILTTPVTGKMDGTVDLTKTTIPANWVLAGEDPRTTDVKLGTKNPDIIVPIKHGTTDVSDTDPNAQKTVTRTITIHMPDGTTKTVTQTARFHRTATKDLVTGTVTYGQWSAAQTWDAFTPTAIAGYVAVPTSVAAVTVTPDMADQTVVISYRALPATTPTQPGQQEPGAMNGTHAGQALTGTVSGPAKVAGTNQTQAKRLPQTGNAASRATAIAGLSLMGVAASLLGMGNRRKHEN